VLLLIYFGVLRAQIISRRTQERLALSFLILGDSSLILSKEQLAFCWRGRPRLDFANGRAAEGADGDEFAQVGFRKTTMMAAGRTDGLARFVMHKNLLCCF